MQRDVLVQKVEVLEGEQEMLKGSLFQASLPVVGTLVGLAVARWRLKVHKKRLAELPEVPLEERPSGHPAAGENPDAEVIDREALERRFRSHGVRCPHGDDVGCCLICTPVVVDETRDGA